MVLVIISWVVLGLIVGFAASKIVNLRGDEPLIGILAALSGAIVAGLIFKFRAVEPYEAWTAGNAIWTVAGAAIAVTIYHLIRSRSISKDQGTVRSSY